MVADATPTVSPFRRLGNGHGDLRQPVLKPYCCADSVLAAPVLPQNPRHYAVHVPEGMKQTRHGIVGIDFVLQIHAAAVSDLL